MSGDFQTAALTAGLLAELTDRRVRFAKRARLQGRALSAEDERVWANAELNRLLADHQAEAVRIGGVRLTDAQIGDVRRTVLDRAFVGGRLVRLFESRPTATNMTVLADGPTYFEMPDGTVAEGEPVASSDEELFAEVAAMAGAMGVKEVRWDPTEPELELMLSDGSRLTAQRWVVPTGTFVTIRRHTLPTVTYDSLVRLGSMTPRMASFMTAAVRAGMRIVVSGRMNAGKTVFVRASAAAIPAFAHVITVESQMELMLHRHPDVYGPRVTPMEARRANSEGMGEISLESNIIRAQRMSPDWVIVGEIRGPEVRALMAAIQQGYPVLSTLHANGPVDAIYNMAQYYEQYAQATYTSSVRRCASNIDVSVHVRKLGNGLRVVDAISRIRGADGDQVISEPVWQPRTDRVAVFNDGGKLDTEFLDRLAAEGYDPHLPDRPSREVAA